MQGIHTAKLSEIRDIIDPPSPLAHDPIISEDMLVISSLALDGDLPINFLDLPLTPKSEDIVKLWVSLEEQASIQAGEFLVRRRGAVRDPSPKTSLFWRMIFEHHYRSVFNYLPLTMYRRPLAL